MTGVHKRVLGTALAAALSASGGAVAKGVTTFAAVLKQMRGGDETGTSDPQPPRYRKRGGYSVAHGKRMARKRRNQLRAKGQFRKAVR